MAITPLPSAPEVTDTPQEFNTKAFAWVASLDTFVTEANAQAVTVNSDASSASSSASTATTKAAEAAASAAAAVQTANITAWSSGATYAVGDNVYSPIDFKTYRNKTGTNTSTDPSSDDTNWEVLTFSLPSQSGETGKFLTTDGTDVSWAAIPDVVPDNGYLRNRIINGDMRIAQRGTAAVTANGAFPVDRFFVQIDTDGAFSAQQDTSAPAGFVNSLKFTTTTADASLGALQYAQIQQRFEGTNVADLAWGSASAKTVTLSFWVRSSLTGTFGGSLLNGAANRSYPFTYTISVADTWEEKTITVAGDTSGTWLTTTGIGLRVNFGLGVGSTYSGTAGSWAGSEFYSATGAVSVIGTLDATWYITGVQLEVGSTATPFERRPYGTELTLCQRYCIRYGPSIGYGLMQETGQYTTDGFIYFPNPMRGAPSLTAPASSNFNGLTTANSGPSFVSGDEKVVRVRIGYGGSTSAGATYFFTGGASAYLLFTSEL